MGGLWRASKSRLVSKIGEASNDEELNKLKPDNISSMHDWNNFIKHKPVQPLRYVCSMKVDAIYFFGSRYRNKLS